MRVSTRLLLIIAACMMPTMALYALIGINLWSERKAQLADLSVQQANLLAGDLNSVAEGARILLASAAEFHQVRSRGESCSVRLAQVQRNVPSFRFLAYVDEEGRVQCASDSALLDGKDVPPWARIPQLGSDFTAGGFTRSIRYPGGFLPFYFRIEQPAPGQSGTLVAGLDLNWLEQHLHQIKRDGSPFMAGGVLTIADANGVVLARDERHAEFVGKRFPPAALPMIHATKPGILRLKSMDGAERLVGYSPPTPESHNLAVAVGFQESELMGDLARALWRWGWLLAGLTSAVFGFTILVARRSIARPAQNLVAVARQWQEGELTARAPQSDERSEFGQIAAAYNTMAAALQCREERLRAHAAAQERQVAERTQELTLANERLRLEIAERQTTETALLQAQKVQAVGQLAGGIAHDFNNILQVVSGSATLIQRRAGDTAATRRLGKMIEDVARRGTSITRRLLAFSRREELRAEILDLDELISGLHEVLTATLGAGIRVGIDLPANLPAISADRGQLETALLNLGTNARDAMPHGGELRISVSTCTLGHSNEARLPAGDYVCVSVSDSGEGMDAETLARATEPFFTTKPLGQGTGLGLAMARSFAEGTGGRLMIKSTPNQGTDIALWLPAVARHIPRHVSGAPGRASGRSASQSTRILVVDDDAAVREVLAEPLIDEGFEVLEAADFSSALKILDTEPEVDLLITDLAMPGPDGLALIREAQRRQPMLPAILLTGYTGAAAELAVGEALEGRFCLLRKPVTPAQLVDQVTVLTAASNVSAMT